MTMYISLPAINKKVSLGTYVKAIKAARANPTVEFKSGLSTWWPTTGAEIVLQFRGGVHARINMRGRGDIVRHVPRHQGSMIINPE